MTGDNTTTAAPANQLNHYVVHRDLNEVSNIGFGIYQIGRLIQRMTESSDLGELDSEMLVGLGIAVTAMGSRVAWNNTVGELVDHFDPDKTTASEVRA